MSVSVPSESSSLHLPISHERTNSRQLYVFKATEPIENHYKFGKRLGQPGQFGYAVLATHKKTGAVRAVKVISKARFNRSDARHHYDQLRSEIDVMRSMDHMNIIRLFDVFESTSELYIVMEACMGGELFDRIKEQGAYTEKDASLVLRQMCQGIKYMHERGIAHCDLKPDNFLFLDKSPNSPLKIIDFGMSKFVQKRKYFQVICGTPYYCAPEVISGKYSEQCDVWSLGVVMFVMLFGYPPFYADQEKYGAETDERIFRLIQRGFEPVTQDGYGAHFPRAIPCSESAKDLISKLLDSNTTTRLTAAEALDHPWLTGHSASDKPILPVVFSNLKNFNGSCKLKQAVLNMMSTSLTEAEVETLKTTFTSIDENGDGTITVDELRRAVQRNSDLKQYSEQIESIIAAADVDGDGAISYQEMMMTCVQRKLNAKEERLWDAFSRLDLNGDGKVSAEEVQQVLKMSLSEAKKLIEEVDRDGNGEVDYDEFITMWTAREEKQRAQVAPTSTAAPPPAAPS